MDRIRPTTGKTDRIVFWMDPKGEFSDTIDDLVIPDTSVIRWDGFDSFRIKVRVECEEPESRFLIYRSGQVPDDQYNILADMMHYSKPNFSADNVSCVCQEMDIEEQFKDVIRNHMAFFKNAKNRSRFKRFGPFRDSDSIIGSMIATLLKTEDNSTDAIVLRMISEYSDEEGAETMDSLLDRFDLADDLWSLCESEYGFGGSSLRELTRDLMMTAAFGASPLADSPKLSKYILPERVRCTSLVDRMLNDKDCSEHARELSESISERYGIPSILKAFDIEELTDCDIFGCVDKTIIDRLIDRIIGTRSPLGSTEYGYIENRLRTNDGRHFEPHYRMLESASRLIEACSVFSKRQPSSDAKTIISGYVSEHYTIDTLYRHFISSFDRVQKDRYVSEDKVHGLFDFIENTYCNVFLGPVVSDLCSKISDYSDLPGPYQQDFCSRYIDENRKTVVIISDAFRYECAAELCERLSSNSRFDKRQLDYMISTVPSKTNFGMAALLPNNGLEVRPEKDGNYAVLIEGQSTESSMREKILKSHYPDSEVLKYEQFEQCTSTELREICSKKKLIYIYHNSIDRTGESDEKRVFESCERAFDEITRIITTVTNWNFTKFIITSDHGFIYRRSGIEEYDKISTVPGFNSRRRFAINDHPYGLDRCIEFPMDYLGDLNKNLYVSVPDSMALFRRQGETKCFAHEGISPQEIVVPVLTVNTIKGSVREKYVGLRPDSQREVKKQYKPQFVFLQEHPVDDEYRGCEYEVWFEDADSQPVTRIYTVAADKSNSSDLKHVLKINEELKTDSLTMFIRMKGSDDVERYDGFHVRIHGFI